MTHGFLLKVRIFSSRLNLGILAGKMGRHRWVLPFVPQVQTTDTKVPLREKVRNTVIFLFIYLVCSQLPLYGIQSTICVQPSYALYWEHILGSRCGTVMQLGMIPILSSRLIVLYFTRRECATVFNIKWEDRVVINTAQKIIAIMLGLCVAVSYVLSGMYGRTDQLGVGNAILIIFQLWFAGIIVICSDELLLKGYGLGPGISLFGAASICGNIMWKAFSPMTVNSGQGDEFEGCVIALFHLLITRTDKAQALSEAFYGQNLYNVTNLLATLLIFLIIIYLQDLLGKWNKSEYGGGHLIPVGGIAYYITAPSSLADMAANPLRALFYLVFTSSTCAWISKTWIRASLTSPLDVAYQIAKHMTVFQSALLFRFIPRAAALGGMSIGVLTVFANSTGAFSSAPGILLVVTIISHYLEIFEKEKLVNKSNIQTR